jgi:hypothetical protein
VGGIPDRSFFVRKYGFHRLINTMNDRHNILAHLLVAEEHPHLQEEPAFLEARNALEASEELQAKFIEYKAFVARHPALVDVGGMPAETRERIAKVIAQHAPASAKGKGIELRTWEIRKQFAWAAILVLLLAGMSVISSQIIQKQDHQERQLTLRSMPPQDAFREYVGRTVEGRLPLQHRNPQSAQLVSWLQEQGAVHYEPPMALLDMKGVGCGMMEGPAGKVSVICFDTEQGVAHLFVTCAKSLTLDKSNPPKRLILHHREALQWNDEENAYLFIAHEPEQPLPEVFL